ncbi:MAG: agmatine deiminase family protein [Bacteroidales bacterium]|nr:agmatine deiminase family protein [Bacteroidales bacterium]
MQDIHTPLSKGFFFPAEWEQHESTWLTYPAPNESWPDNFIEVCREYNNFVALISQGEKVNIVTQNTSHSKELADILDAHGATMENIFFYEFTSDDCWCRDHGPAFLINKNSPERAIVKWQFNAWGEKYPSEKDNAIGDKIAALYPFKTYRPPIVMEGGSIEVNGKGTLLTTKACLLNKNRNLALSAPEIEWYLRENYGATNIVWLGNGVEGDDTDGHIDDMVRFVNEHTIIAAVEDIKGDTNYQPLKENFELLKTIKLENGKTPNIVELPMPSPVTNGKERLPASYANFYICNSGVIVPVFGCKNDDKALQVIQSCFPHRNVHALPARNVIYGLGSWHCLSQQEVCR